MAELKKRRRRRKRLPEELVTVEIESLSNEGRGIAHVADRTVFVDQALAGEQVDIRYTRYSQKLTEAKTVAVHKAASDRVVPKCDAFIACGGCSLQHMSHTAQLAMKQQSMLDQLERIGKVQAQSVLPVLEGPVWQYRHKARLGVRYVRKKEKALVGFRERGSSLITETERCEVLHPAVGDHIGGLSRLISSLEAREQLPQIEVAIGDDATVLVFRHLVELGERDRQRLKDFCIEHDLVCLLQAGKPDQLECLHPETQPVLQYTIDDDIRIEFAPNDFTQVNPELNRSMLACAIELMQPEDDDEILDLFSGLGNFSLPLAKRCKRVVGVEGSDVMVKKARDNAERNQIENADFHCADLYSDEITHAPWIKQAYNKVLLDPPRSGAAEVIPLLVKNKPERIVYVSCHPGTLARDAGLLVNEHGYKMMQVGIMDMFPHTAHVESIAVFER